MTSGTEFLAVLERHGVTLVSGVPCSYFTAPLRLLAGHPRIRYVPAANEGSALAVAAGARLAGGRGAVVAQNSGFGNLVNPLTSLVLPYRIPVLVVMSMRGRPAEPGEGQHEIMGRVVPEWLDSMGVPRFELVAGGAPFADVMTRATAVLDEGETAFVLVGKGAIEPDDAALPERPGLTRDAVVRVLAAEVRDEYVLSTTGYLSRSLFAAGDRPRNFYMQGSMGHVGSLALGAAAARKDGRFVALDGDGALLMHLGSLASVGAVAPPNLVHVVFDNGSYESTGGQPCPAVDLAAVARTCGYRGATTVEDEESLRRELRAALDAPGPSLVVARGGPSAAAGDRASESLGLPAIAERFAAEAGARWP